MAPSSENITQLLLDFRDGNESAREALLPLVYDELRRIAHYQLSRNRPGDTLNTTALVHEAYLKLIDQEKAQWNDRTHFFALASRAMRFILVDYARRRSADKRGGGLAHEALDNLQLAAEERTEDVLALDEALTGLARVSEHLAKLVEYKFFGGLTFEEIAQVTNRSTRTIRRDWTKARLWLFREIQSMREDP